MSSATEALVMRVAKAATERDLVAFLELSDPDVEWHSSLSVISEGGAYHGHDGVRQYVRDLDDAFEVFRIFVEGVISVGEIALCVGRVTYRGRVSGAEQTEQFGWVFRFREGRIVHLRAFRNPEGVLEALLNTS